MKAGLGQGSPCRWRGQGHRDHITALPDKSVHGSLPRLANLSPGTPEVLTMEQRTDSAKQAIAQLQGGRCPALHMSPGSRKRHGKISTSKDSCPGFFT